MKYWLVLTLCWLGYAATAESKPDIQVQYQDGPNDEFNSELGVFRRSFCQEPTKFVKASVTQADLERIYRVADSIGFFTWPNELDQFFDPADPAVPTAQLEEGVPERICIIAPCVESVLKIAGRGKSNWVTWGCGCGPEEKYARIDELKKAVESVLNRQRAIQKMENSDCRYR